MPQLDAEIEKVENRVHVITQKIFHARGERGPFPGDEIKVIIDDSVADNTVRYVAYYLATAYDVLLGHVLSMPVKDDGHVARAWH
jgi:hypothetical protein